MFDDPIQEAQYQMAQKKYRNQRKENYLDVLELLISNPIETQSQKIEIFAVEDLFLETGTHDELLHFYRSKIPNRFTSKIELKKLSQLSIVTKSIVMLIMAGYLADYILLGFYSITNFICFSAFFAMFIYEYKAKSFVLAFITLVGCLLFNPFHIFRLSKANWLVADKYVLVTVFILLLIDLYRLIIAHKQ